MKKSFILFALILLYAIRSYAQAPTITSFSPDSGAVGTLVTITGTNLGTPTAFTIGGQSAIIVSGTGSTLVGLVMPGATSGAVSVTTATGTASAAGSFTISATAYPNTQQGQRLLGRGEVLYARLGGAVAISADGNTAVAGGFNDDMGAGAVWVYTRSGGMWAQQGAKLVGTGVTGLGYQGHSVAISADGNTIISGGYGDSLTRGAAWIFTRSGSTWSQQGAKLVGRGNVGTANEGKSVAISADGNTALIGGTHDNNDLGAAWVFTRTGSVWSQQGSKLVGAGAIGAAQQGQSVSLSADGNTAIVGGFNDNGNVGACWVYTRTGTTWSQQGAKLVGSGTAGVSTQGQSVSLSADGNTALVGGYVDNNDTGAVWIFTRSGSVWTQQGPKLVAAGTIGAAYQGSSVSLSADGNTALVGAWEDDRDQGATWVYTRTGGTWTQQSPKLVGTLGSGRPNQGIAVALSADANTAIVGGWGDSASRGAAWIFTARGTNCSARTAALSRSICYGSSYSLGTHILTSAGTYLDTLTTVGGCDSFVTLTLTVAAPVGSSISQRICSGASYHGHTTTGLYHDTLTASGGCDSVLALTLTVDSTYRRAVAQSMCSGSSFTFGGRTLTTSGTYRDTLTTVSGCDSIITLILSVRTVLRHFISQDICEGSSYYFNGRPLSLTGTYQDTLTTSGGCDSIVTLHLGVVSALPVSISDSICAGSTYTFGGQVLSTGGTYADTLTTGTGCDSIVSLSLTILPAPATPSLTLSGQTLFASPAAAYHWYLDGQAVAGAASQSLAITQNGHYTLVVTNAAGCSDSVALDVNSVGIENVKNMAGIRLYPDPNSGVFTLELPDDAPRTVTIADDLGQVIWQQQLHSSKTVIDLGGYASGFYFLRIYQGQEQSTMKFVISGKD